MVYVLELCVNQRQRSICGVLISAFGYFGTLLTYFMGVFLGWRDLAATLSIMTLPYMLAMTILVPESPVFHLRTGKTNEAANSFKKLIGSRQEYSISRAIEV